MRRFLLSALCLTFVVSALVAQSTVGQIRGTIRDSTGSALPGVEVTITQSGVSRGKTSTDAKGEFVFQGLPIGTYALTATLPGFTTFRSTLVLAAGVTSEISIALLPASLAEGVVIAGATPSIGSGVGSGLGAWAGGSAGGGVVGGVAGGAVGGGAGSTASSLYRAAHSPSTFNTEAYDRIDD